MEQACYSCWWVASSLAADVVWGKLLWKWTEERKRWRGGSSWCLAVLIAKPPREEIEHLINTAKHQLVSSTLHLPAFPHVSLPRSVCCIYYLGACTSTETIVCGHIAFRTLIGAHRWILAWPPGFEGELGALFHVLKFPYYLLLYFWSSRWWVSRNLASCILPNLDSRQWWWYQLRLNCRKPVSHTYVYLFNLLFWHWLFSCTF